MIISLDTGPLISIVESCNSWVFDAYKDYELTITPTVYDELINTPSHNLKFKLSVFRMKEMMNKGILKMASSKEIFKLSEEFLNLANQLFFVHGRKLHIVHRGEAEAIGLALISDSKLMFTDERTTRMIIDDIDTYIYLLEREVGPVKFNDEIYEEFISKFGDVKIMRSVEMMAYAFKKLKKENVEFLDAALYSLKFHGCSVTFKEINDYVRSLK